MSAFSSHICVYYTLHFYFPYLSLLAQPVTIFAYGPVTILVYGPVRYLHYYRSYTLVRFILYTRDRHGRDRMV
jgi:hypothetical protein